MGLVKSTPMNLELSSKVGPFSTPGVRNAGRFQVIVEYAAGVGVAAGIAESPEEAVEAFLVQVPGCDEGEIALFDRFEQRVVASVKWKMSGTEIGLRVPPRQNIFHDWHLALIALEVQKCRTVARLSN